MANSEILKDLPTLLSHLSEPQCSGLVELIKSNKSLFADVPSQTHLLKHIDVGVSIQMKQHPYRVKQQVEYMVQHNIAEPSNSAWSSPCLLADEANGEDRICTNFCQVSDKFCRFEITFF